MAQVNPEDLRRIQAERLQKMRELALSDPERARAESYERLVSAGLIQRDGRPTPPYA